MHPFRSNYHKERTSLEMLKKWGNEVSVKGSFGGVQGLAKYSFAACLLSVNVLVQLYSKSTVIVNIFGVHHTFAPFFSKFGLQVLSETGMRIQQQERKLLVLILKLPTFYSVTYCWNLCDWQFCCLHIFALLKP